MSSHEAGDHRIYFPSVFESPFCPFDDDRGLFYFQQHRVEERTKLFQLEYQREYQWEYHLEHHPYNPTGLLDSSVVGDDLEVVDHDH